ncbi:MAG: hypothetical protein JSS14_22100 [Proteobacteria bacterium]|nr:hypothetical protein [Pseudomonadota bacterium]
MNPFAKLFKQQPTNNDLLNKIQQANEQIAKVAGVKQEPPVPYGADKSFVDPIEYQRFIDEFRRMQYAQEIEAKQRAHAEAVAWEDFMVHAHEWPSHLTKREHLEQAARSGNEGAKQILANFTAYKTAKRMTK